MTTLEVLVSNNASTTLRSALAANATTLTVQTGAGAMFPQPTVGTSCFYGTLYDEDNNIEIVRVTARTGDSMTITRGIFGTARAYKVGDGFDLRPTAELFEAMIQQSDLDSALSDLQTTLEGEINSADGDLGNRLTAIENDYTTSGDLSTYVAGNIYTKTQADGRFVKLAGGSAGQTVSGPITFSGNTTVTGATLSAKAITASGAVTAQSFTSTSDRRLKEDIESLDPMAALLKIYAADPVRFSWIGEKSKTKHLGFIAQDLKQVLPEAVEADERGFYSVNYDCLVAVCFAAIQGLMEEIRQLKKEMK